MGTAWYHLNLAAGDYGTVMMLIALAIVTALGILVASAIVGPRRAGPIKNDTYESGMEPVGNARRRFNVKFYMVAVLFLIFDVELIFFYPWAVLFPRLTQPDADQQAWVDTMAGAGYGPGFMLAAMGVFFALLLVGFVYECRRGVFKWN